MIFYLVIFGILPLSKIFVQNRQKRIAFLSFILFLILSLRSTSIGDDLVVYEPGYQYINQFSFDEIFQKLHLISTADLIEPYSFESGYVLLNWVFAKLGFNFHFFLVIYAAFVSYSLYSFLVKYSKNDILSFAIFLSYSWFEYSFGILRQTMVTCIFMWGIQFLEKKEYFKYYVLVLIAFSIHRISFIMGVIPFVMIINKNIKRYYLLLAAVIVFAFISPFVLTNILRKILVALNKINYASSLSFNFNTTIVFVFITAILAGWKIEGKLGFFDRIITSTLIVSSAVAVVGMFNDVLSRGVLVTLVVMIIVIPNYISKIEDKNMSVLFSRLIFISFLGLYYYTISSSIIVPYETLLCIDNRLINWEEFIEFFFGGNK